MILTYPHSLQARSKFKIILDNLSIPYTCDVNSDYDIVFNSNINPIHEFDLKTDKPVINRFCTNVSKDYVDKRWKSIYGHGLKVDPLTWGGYCIEKPQGQGTNSGEIVFGVHPKEGMFYSKIVDTRMDATTLHDLRVVIMNGEIILILRKKKHIVNVFTNPHKFEQMTINIFTDEEQDAILSFSSMMDFGEVDIVRSNFDGRIYILDVNNLPGYGYFRDKKYIDLLSYHFNKYYNSL